MEKIVTPTEKISNRRIRGSIEMVCKKTWQEVFKQSIRRKRVVTNEKSISIIHYGILDKEMLTGVGWLFSLSNVVFVRSIKWDCFAVSEIRCEHHRTNFESIFYDCHLGQCRLTVRLKNMMAMPLGSSIFLFLLKFRRQSNSIIYAMHPFWMRIAL